MAISHGIIDCSNALAITFDKPSINAQSPPPKTRQHHRIACNPDDHARADGLAGTRRKHALRDNAERVLLCIGRAANTQRSRPRRPASRPHRSLGDMRILQPGGACARPRAAPGRGTGAARPAGSAPRPSFKTLRALCACLRGTATCAARLRLIRLISSQAINCS
jgi:hypothetical protein